MTTTCGTIALIGPPNAGKSTLINRLVGTKISIVTPKAQTTRTRVTGVLVEGEAQLVFLDVPGVFPAERQYERAMVEAAWGGAGEADIIVFMFDARKMPGEEAEAALKKIADMGKPLVLALNKIDSVDNKPTILSRIDWFKDRATWNEIIPISAAHGDGVDVLKSVLLNMLPAGEWRYPEDTLTDLPMRILASELTREQCFLQLQQELPYALTVVTEKYDVREGGSVEIHQAVIVENERQKMIVIGKGGQMLKKIGERARKEIARAADATCHLYLFVKVREDWKLRPEESQLL